MDSQGTVTEPRTAGATPQANGVALLFPGQGSQTPGMRELVERERPDLLEAAIDACGSDPFARIDEGTAYAQPALYAASIAAWERAGRPEAVATAGHSLGELAALAAAGSLDPADGLRLAAQRGEIMQSAAADGPAGGMLAVFGDEEVAQQMASEFELAVANHNTIGQLVLSGPLEHVEAARGVARERGVKAMKLPVTGAFHSPALDGAVPRFREALSEVSFADPVVTVFSCSTAEPFDDIRDTLAEALVRPVRWTETLRALDAAGTERFWEVGPGKVLTGLVRRTLPDAEAVALEAGHG